MSFLGTPFVQKVANFSDFSLTLSVTDSGDGGLVLSQRKRYDSEKNTTWRNRYLPTQLKRRLLCE